MTLPENFILSSLMPPLAHRSAITDLPGRHTPIAEAPLTLGAHDLLSACEDVVQEIRFHQTALFKAIERKQTMTERLLRLWASVEQRARCTPGGEEPSECLPPAPEEDLPSAAPMAVKTTPRLAVHGFGQCRVLQDDVPVEGWTHSKGKAIFKYLVLQRRHPVAKEVLMQTFWPDADLDSARNNLNVAIYGLRKTLARQQPSLTHVLLEDGRYRLHPDLDLWCDVEQFEELVRQGRRLEAEGHADQAVARYREAEQLYRDDLFIEDRAEDWLAPERQRLRDMAVDALRRLSGLLEGAGDPNASVVVCRRLLDIDPCDEEMHRHLMGLYQQLDQPHLALRQFQTCAEALSRELHMIPSPSTTALFRQIQRREAQRA